MTMSTFLYHEINDNVHIFISIMKLMTISTCLYVLWNMSWN